MNIMEPVPFRLVCGTAAVTSDLSMSVPRLSVNTSSRPKPGTQTPRSLCTAPNSGLKDHASGISCRTLHVPSTYQPTHVSYVQDPSDMYRVQSFSSRHVRHHGLSSARHPGALALNAMCQMLTHKTQSEPLSPRVRVSFCRQGANITSMALIMQREVAAQRASLTTTYIRHAPSQNAGADVDAHVLCAQHQMTGSNVHSVR